MNCMWRSKWSRKKNKEFDSVCCVSLSLCTFPNSDRTRWKSMTMMKRNRRKKNDAMFSLLFDYCCDGIAVAVVVAVDFVLTFKFSTWRENRFERKQRSEKCVFKFIHTLEWDKCARERNGAPIAKWSVVFFNSVCFLIRRHVTLYILFIRFETIFFLFGFIAFVIFDDSSLRVSFDALPHRRFMLSTSKFFLSFPSFAEPTEEKKTLYARDGTPKRYHFILRASSHSQYISFYTFIFFIIVITFFFLFSELLLLGRSNQNEPVPMEMNDRDGTIARAHENKKRKRKTFVKIYSHVLIWIS